MNDEEQNLINRIIAETTVEPLQQKSTWMSGRFLDKLYQVLFKFFFIVNTIELTSDTGWWIGKTIRYSILLLWFLTYNIHLTVPLILLFWWIPVLLVLFIFDLIIKSTAFCFVPFVN